MFPRSNLQLPRSFGLLRLALACAALLAVQAAGVARAQAPDVTEHLEWLGNPGKLSYPADAKTFARNVWHLKAFDGRLYVGIGNRDNAGPAPNAGPVDIWSYRPATGRFVKEWTAPDEQVEIFRVIDGRLVVPGNDPQEPWELGNFYRLEKDGWRKYRTLPNGLHIFDMIKFDGVLYAALGTQAGAVVAASDDDGLSWRTYQLVPVIRGYYARAYSLFVLAGRLYASASSRFGGVIFVFTKGTFLPMRKSDFFPGFERERHLTVQAYTPFRGQGVYIATDRGRSGLGQPVGLFAASNSQDVRPIELPPGAAPRAIVAADARLLVLASRPSGEGYENIVIETRDLVQWREAFRFRTPTFARAFEVLDGDVYFGLGSTQSNVSPQTGEILRLPARHATGR
jgi:hypothetical protein